MPDPKPPETPDLAALHARMLAAKARVPKAKEEAVTAANTAEAAYAEALEGQGYTSRKNRAYRAPDGLLYQPRGTGRVKVIGT